MRRRCLRRRAVSPRCTLMGHGPRSGSIQRMVVTVRERGPRCGLGGAVLPNATVAVLGSTVENRGSRFCAVMEERDGLMFAILADRQNLPVTSN